MSFSLAKFTNLLRKKMREGNFASSRDSIRTGMTVTMSYSPHYGSGGDIIDLQPLVVVTDSGPLGFTGINILNLDEKIRHKILSSLYKIHNLSDPKARDKLLNDYISSISKELASKNLVKTYKYSNVKRKIYITKPEEILRI